MKTKKYRIMYCWSVLTLFVVCLMFFGTVVLNAQTTYFKKCDSKTYLESIDDCNSFTTVAECIGTIKNCEVEVLGEGCITFSLLTCNAGSCPYSKTVVRVTAQCGTNSSFPAGPLCICKKLP